MSVCAASYRTAPVPAALPSTYALVAASSSSVGAATFRRASGTVSSTPAVPCASFPASSAAFVKWIFSPVPNDSPSPENSAPVTRRLPVSVPSVLSSLPSSAALTALFCTGFSDAASSATSTTVLFAPASTPSSLVLSAADIRPLADVVATAVPALPSSASLTALFWTGFVLVASSAASTMVFVAPDSMLRSLV